MLNGLYDMQKPDRPEAEALLSFLGLTTDKHYVGRYRDCYFSKDGQSIIVYTRNGGGNRKDYKYIFDKLSKHPNYIKDYDDDFDETYASIEFSIPEKFKDAAAELFKSANTETGPEVQARHLADLEKMDHEEYLAKYPKMRPLFDAMEAMASGNIDKAKDFGGISIVQMN